MDLRIDHVTVAGRDLDRLTEAFEAAGFPVAYGGQHSNGVTHMAIVGFRDGSYVELISTLEDGAASPWWDSAIRENGGPCAWAVGVDDVAARTATLRDRGVPVDGPAAFQREREDGTLVEWDLTYLEDGDPGARLPFLIEDRTPRERRVQPTGDLASSPVQGVDTVVIGVPDLDDSVKAFETAFDAAEPTRSACEDLDATVASFPGLPVALARPRGDGWLADRVERFGASPAAYLLGYDADADHGFADCTAGAVGERAVEWLPVTHPVGRPYLGLVATDE
ncbi:VOC family protein [Haloparvum sedimenti]|uniref:VOC family protein n=1 Tax=Haloparvum sedimenti TaxID=1678448 RepID=UPI00071E9157|nr:VOC family protein [Haloparvum sedimenti]